MLLTLAGILAMAPSPQGGEQAPWWITMAPIALIFAMFYFLLIAPARKKQKKHAELIGNLKPGDKVITNGGIHGTVAGISDQVLQIKIADQVKIEVSKTAIAGFQQEQS